MRRLVCAFVVHRFSHVEDPYIYFRLCCCFADGPIANDVSAGGPMVGRFYVPPGSTHYQTADMKETWDICVQLKRRK